MTILSYAVDRVGVRQLDNEIRALGLTSAVFRGVAFSEDGALLVIFDDQPSAGDIVAIDAAVAAHTPPPRLLLRKRIRARAIDVRTEELLVEDGFQFKNHTIPLTLQNQILITALYNARASATYPIELMAKSNLVSVSVDSEGEAVDLHADMVDALVTFHAGGTAIKKQIAAATDFAELRSVEDNR